MTDVRELPLAAFEMFQGRERIMQLGVGMTLYFPRPFQKFQKEILAFWHAYADLVGLKTFTWARLGGGNRSRAASPAVLKTIEAWLDGSKDPGETCWISLHDGPMDAIGKNSFMLTGEGDAETEWDEESSCIDVVFPVEMLQNMGSAAFADALIALAAHVPFEAGVAGYVFHRSPYKFHVTIAAMRALSKRFPGVEISAAERLAYLAGRGIPSVNWLTFVGATHLGKLGGVKLLAERLRGISDVLALPHGAVVKTGESPETGDRNRGDDALAPLRRAYGVLRAAQFVDEAYAFDDIRFPGDATVEWLTRLAP